MENNNDADLDVNTGMPDSQNKNNNEINWDDDSGVIHTVTDKYDTSWAEGFQENHAYTTTNSLGKDNQFIRGKQCGFIYVTDDYRKVLPGYIIITVLMVALAVVLFLKANLIIALMYALFAAAFIYGFWKNVSVTKWKNQAKRLKEEKKKE